MKMFKRRRDTTSKWIKDLVSQVIETKVGKFCMETPTEVDASEGNKVLTPDELLIRQNFSTLVEDGLVIGFSVIYGFMFKKLMPDG